MQYLQSVHADVISRRVHRAALWNALKTGLRTFVSLMTLAGVAFLLVSAPAQWDRLYYWYDGLRSKTESAFASELNTKNWVSPSRFVHEPQFESVLAVAEPQMDEESIYIPSIDVRAPLLADIPLTDSLNGLQEGVVHARESTEFGLPGRSFVIGHSSGNWWNNNPWTKVFALLEQTQTDDVVFVRHAGVTFAYRMTNREVVTPDNVSVIRDESLDHNQLALMTCTPIGTALNRLIVYAEPLELL